MHNEGKSSSITTQRDEEPPSEVVAAQLAYGRQCGHHQALRQGVLVRIQNTLGYDCKCYKYSSCSGNGSSISCMFSKNYYKPNKQYISRDECALVRVLFYFVELQHGIWMV